MFYLICGGSGSGKSEYAEGVSTTLHQTCEGAQLVYIATMQANDAEAKAKVQRHRFMRKDKGFVTYECFTNLNSLSLPENSTVLLDCMSNLVANELYDGQNRSPEEVAVQVKKGIEHLHASCRHLVVVTNDVFGDGASYAPSVREYVRCLGEVNCAMAKQADVVTEVVCSIPVFMKGSEKACGSL